MKQRLNKYIFLIKTLTSLLLTFILLFIVVESITANAAEIQNESQIQIEYLGNGDYIEIVIKDEAPDEIVIPPLANTITKTKTNYYKNSAGEVMWSVSIKATFTYNGSSSKCTSCSHSASAPNSAWSIKSVSSSKSGNTATARATATYKDGSLSKDYPMSVTIKCSATGVVS